MSNRAANTFLDFFNVPMFFPFLLVVLIIGTSATFGLINNVGGGMCSFAWPLSVSTSGIGSPDTVAP